jgi:DNA polymerase
MRWAILTPHRSVRWCPDTRQLTDGPPAQRADAPPADAGEALWLTYYRHIFNPARLNVPLMRQHMPAKYWRNLPEAAEIAALVAAAPTRTARMIEQAPGARVVAPRGPRRNPDHVDDVDQPLRTLAELSAAVQHCTACPLAQHATQGVSGSGPLRPPLMLVGEQPGDREDLAGLPFVGPAGQLLDQALAQAGIDRAQLYLTNAVRHFKHELRGKRRLHKTPAQREVMACRPWLLREIELVQPQAIVALGATAARALLGPGVKLAALRGQPWPGPGGRPVWVTWHPAALLRLPADERQRTWPMWIADLAHASNAAAP